MLDKPFCLQLEVVYTLMLLSFTILLSSTTRLSDTIPSEGTPFYLASNPLSFHFCKSRPRCRPCFGSDTLPRTVLVPWLYSGCSDLVFLIQFLYRVQYWSVFPFPVWYVLEHSVRLRWYILCLKTGIGLTLPFDDFV